MPGVLTDRRQGITASAAVKVPCTAATTANITLSGEQTVDGIACIAGDRVLVKSQTSGIENGIYYVNTSAWQRSPDWDGTLDVRQSTFVYVSQGSTNTGFWYVTTADPIIPGTTSITIGRASTILATVSGFAQTLLDDADAATARSTLGAAASGANSDITSLSGLTTALSITQGGTGQTTAAAAFAAIKQAASDTATGVVELATNTEALAGTDTTRAVTSAGLASSKSLATNGYMKFPGGLIIQWGTSLGGDPASVTFPLAFPNSCTAITGNGLNTTAVLRSVVTSAPSSSTTGFTARIMGDGDLVISVDSFSWIAIGY